MVKLLVSCQKPFISEKNNLVRLKFTQDFIKQPPVFWNGVLFIDEGNFNLLGSDKRTIVWRKART